MQYQDKSFSHPDDDYYFQYLIYHAVQAEDHYAIQNILKDFLWMNTKLRSDSTIYNLCMDLEMVISYLKSEEKEVFDIY